MPEAEEKSLHWDERKDLPRLKTGLHDCWPCREGFPRFPWHNSDGPPLFEIVTAWGLRAEARIDDTREFSAEGLEWVIVEGEGRNRRLRNVDSIQVACWRRIPGRSSPRSR